MQIPQEMHPVDTETAAAICKMDKVFTLNLFQKRRQKISKSILGSDFSIVVEKKYKRSTVHYPFSCSMAESLVGCFQSQPVQQYRSVVRIENFGILDTTFEFAALCHRSRQRIVIQEQKVSMARAAGAAGAAQNHFLKLLTQNCAKMSEKCHNFWQP